MDAPHSRAAPLAGPVEVAGVPGCDSGPGGRLAFVIREFAAAIGRHRTYRSRRTR